MNENENIYNNDPPHEADILKGNSEPVSPETVASDGKQAETTRPSRAAQPPQVYMDPPATQAPTYEPYDGRQQPPMRDQYLPTTPTQYPGYGQQPPQYGNPQPPQYQRMYQQPGSVPPINEPYRWDYNNFQAPNNAGVKEKKKTGVKTFVIALAGSLILGVGALALMGTFSTKMDPGDIIAGDSGGPIDTEATQEDGALGDNSLGNTEDLIKQPSGGILTTPEVAAKVKPSVVGILRYENTLYDANGLGSGFILSAEDGVGYVVTNAHVVEAGTNFKVRLHDEREYDAELVGADVESDLAVLRIKADGLVPAEMGDSNTLLVGEPVLAVGNPISMDLSGSVTYGIVSAVNRNLHTGTSVNYIQTDAAINPGNSGGALANQYGQVIGINTMKVQGTGFEGIGFAIPISEALPIVEELVAYGRVASRPALGIQGKEITELVAYQQNCPVGIMVLAVNENANFTPTLNPEDIITHADGNRILGLSDLKEVLNNKAIGDDVALTVYRRVNTVDTEELDVVAVLIPAGE